MRPHVPPSRVDLLAGAFLTPALRRQYPELRREVLGRLPRTHHLLIHDLEEQALTDQDNLRLPAQCLGSHLHHEGALVIKCGADGAVPHRQGRVSPHAAPAVTVRDTMGAGDIWNAAYLDALCRGQAAVDAAAFAVQVASTAVSTDPRRYLSPGE